MDLKDQFEKLTKKAENFYSMGEISKAHNLFLESEKIALDLANNKLIAKAKKNVGRTFHRLGKYENAEKYYLEAIEILENQEIIEELPGYLNHLASNYMKLYNFKNCFSTLKKALQIANEIDDNYSIGKIKNTLGVYYEYLGDFNKSLKLYQEALKIFDDLKEDSALSKTYNLLSSVKRKLGDIKYASNALKKAKKIAQNNNDVNNLSHSLINKVDILFEKGDHEEIRKILPQILKLEEKIENFELRSVIERKLGRVYQNEGKFKLSLEHYEKALKIASRINYKDGIAKAFKNMGLLHLELEEFLSAYRFFSKSIKTLKKISESISDPKLRKFYAKSYADVPEILKEIDKIIENKSYEIKDDELISTLDDAKTVCKTIQEEKINENMSRECKDDTNRLFHHTMNIIEKREMISLQWREILSEECFSKLKEDTRKHLILYKHVLMDSAWDYGSCIQKISNAIEAQLKDSIFASFQSLWESKFNINYYYHIQDLKLEDKPFKKTFFSFIGFLRYNNFLSLEKIQKILETTLQIKNKNSLSKPFLEFQEYLGPENIIIIKEILKFLDYEFECGNNEYYSFIIIRGNISHGGKKQEKKIKIKIELNEDLIKNIENKLINEDLNLLHNLCSLKV